MMTIYKIGDEVELKGIVEEVRATKTGTLLYVRFKDAESFFQKILINENAFCEHDGERKNGVCLECGKEI